jgi:adenosylcobyric acid synthase
MGATEPGGDAEAFDGDGAASADGLVFGTYMHGLFANPSAVDALLAYLSETRGDAYMPCGADSGDPFDRLAACFEEHVDMAFIASLCRAP